MLPAPTIDGARRVRVHLPVWAQRGDRGQREPRRLPAAPRVPAVRVPQRAADGGPGDPVPRAQLEVGEAAQCASRGEQAWYVWFFVPFVWASLTCAGRVDPDGAWGQYYKCIFLVFEMGDGVPELQACLSKDTIYLYLERWILLSVLSTSLWIWVECWVGAGWDLKTKATKAIDDGLM